ncbi:MAG: radical SAM protein, partial [Actinomycetota bacterium]
TTEAAALGFRSLGVTGGEPFLLPYLPDLLGSLAAVLPLIVLSNGTLFDGARLARLARLGGLPLKIQLSLDRPDPITNDALRGPDNFAKVVEAIPRLLDLGIGVRIATTLGDADPAELARLCHLHRELGVSDDDHVVRPIVRRGRAASNGMGVTAGSEELQPELTITADGAFWSPFAPTVEAGRLDIDMLITRTTSPLSVPADAMLRVVEGRPRGDDSLAGIR